MAASHTHELHLLLTTGLMIRREKAKILKGLPPKQRVTVPVAIADDSEREELLRLLTEVRAPIRLICVTIPLSNPLQSLDLALSSFSFIIAYRIRIILIKSNLLHKTNNRCAIEKKSLRRRKDRNRGGIRPRQGIDTAKVGHRRRHKHLQMLQEGHKSRSWLQEGRLQRPLMQI